MILNNLKNIKNILLDALFPVYCQACRKEGFWLCEDCLKQTKVLDFQVCPDCENIITDKGFLCPRCRSSGKLHLDAMLCAVSYDKPAIKQLVHNFKYRFVRGIAGPLADLLNTALLRNDFPLPDFLVPVPLHPRRLRWRGFNQGLLLAEYISENLSPLMKTEVLDFLGRVKFNRPQMGIKSYQDRLKNVQGVIGLKADADLEKIKNKKVLLIDDIATTGATLEECAKVLKAAGAKKVFAAVVARQSLKK
ncbi:MAG: hypothetical protein A3J76_05325 [Candidatus Moranbacteria bacterium RBG_13_45_13]|nr:MAG: hypothetical protein A3J76_05325 [Candidatus Moranbacteria bacterium RBG_13_45_13]